MSTPLYSITRWLKKPAILLFILFPLQKTLAQDYVIKFFAYPADQTVFYPSGKGIYGKSPNEHLIIMFEKRREYEKYCGYSPDRIIPNLPWYKSPNYTGQFFEQPWIAFAVSMREEMYYKLQPDSVMQYFTSLTDCMIYANELLAALGKNVPDLGKLMTPAEYIYEIKRLNMRNFSGFVTDPRDGKVYSTVKIGNQTWMSENLNYRPDSVNTHHPQPETFGRLYDWCTAMSACPEGWHLSTMQEWDTLIALAGGPERAAMNLKSEDFWLYPENNPPIISTDSLGFRVMPAAYPPRMPTGHAWFWTATETHPDVVMWVGFSFYHREPIVKNALYGDALGRGQSVRCVEDE